MYHFWESTLLPLLRAAEPKSLVEIGVERGLLTEQLLGYAAEAGAVVHAIDPEPQIDVDRWREQHGDAFDFHRALSLEVLGDVRDATAVFIDGDHNWFTVYHELKLLEQTSAEDETPAPLIVMHDVDWPYARRDLYYDPSTIPEEHRQPYRQTGMVPGESGLVETGANPHLYNAVSEGSARNGVRTALEDFISESPIDWSQTFIPGFHGLAVIVSVQQLEDNEALGAAIERLRSPEFLESWARELELARIQSGIEAEVRIAEEQDSRTSELRALDSRLREFDRLQAQLAQSESRLAAIPDLRLRIAELERQLQDAHKATEAANHRANDLDERLTDARRKTIEANQWLQDIQTSPSWRVTAPLRRVKRLLTDEG